MVFAKVRGDYPDIYEASAEIMLDPDAIETVLRECYFSLFDASSDPIGDAFEVFVGSESRGRAGQFFTPRTVTDFLVKALHPRPGELILDPACGAGGFLASVARDFSGRGMDARELSSLASKTFYGIDKDAYLVKLAKLHVSLLTNGHPHLACGDSIALQSDSGGNLDAIQIDGFDVILTNPPFGARIVAAKPEVLRTFELGRKWKESRVTGRWESTTEIQSQVPPQVLFVERCLSLLKVGGRLGIVLPESLLSNKSYRHVVEFLLRNSDIQAVIGMPESLFKTSGKGGTHTKTCLVVAMRRKRELRPSGRRTGVFMAEAKWCGQDSRARSIPHNDLPQIGENLENHRLGKKLARSTLGFMVPLTDVTSNVLCPRYYDPQLDQDLEALSKTHELVTFAELVEEGTLAVRTGDELGKLAYGTGDVPFIRTSDISNWELKADPKHGVDRSIFESLRRKQDVQPHDILMVKDGTYLIGTCAIIADGDTEIIYQSHLYKIRVLRDGHGINPFLLLAVMSSPIVQRQIRGKQFTQDIIDSLGERINELVLPLPMSKKTRDTVTAMVQKAVRLRIEARQLVKEAKAAIECRNGDVGNGARI
jgi:type I restriction enzyme M protein